MSRYFLKKRAPQGQLAQLTHNAREQLHSWLRERDGTITLKEVQARVKATFGFTVSQSSLSAYYSKNFKAITNLFGAQATAEPTTIVFRIDVPTGCRIDVSTTTASADEEGRSA